MNLKNNIMNLEKNMNVQQLDYGSIVMKYFESNIDSCCECEHMNFIKDCFWENKNRNFFKNDKINVAIHIRRENSHDKGLAGPRATTPNNYYLNIMNTIRDKYKDSSKNINNKKLLFHIYSQGEMTQFQDLTNNDVKFYLNYDIIESFTGMVSAEILVTSPSSLSYVAALISDGEIHYKKFWHNPRKNWIIYE
jgi:dTDP-D-glucose 4,6-dehydratase